MGASGCASLEIAPPMPAWLLTNVENEINEVKPVLEMAPPFTA